MLEKCLSKLTLLQRDLFERTYKSHLATMVIAMSEKHSLENIKAVKWDKKESCLKVYFNHGDGTTTIPIDHGDDIDGIKEYKFEEPTVTRKKKWPAY